MTHDVRVTLHEVAAGTTPPPVDEVAFRSLVRRARRRRSSTRLAVAGAAAASVAAVAAWALPLGTSHRADVAPADGDRTAVRAGRLHEPVYLTRGGGRLLVLDPNGVTHDLHFSSEGIVGFNTEFALVLDRDSHIVRFDADSGSEGPDGTWTFTRGTTPVPFTVGSAAMSADGRWLAVTNLRGDLVRYDLKAGTRSVDHVGGDPSVVDVAAAGTLVMSDGDLTLRTDDGETVLAEHNNGYSASLAGDRISVPDDEGRTHVYDLAGDKVATPQGHGVLSPDGQVLLAIRAARNDVTSVWQWTPKEEHELPGVVGYASDVRWVDEDTALVTTFQDLWVCETLDRSCGRLTLGGTGDIRISR
jgi:hypothetical protein